MMTSEQLAQHANTWNWFGFQGFYDEIAKIERFQYFVEVGVWKGHSISYLAKLIKSRERKDQEGIRLYAVDLFEKSPMFQGEHNEKIGLVDEVKIVREIYEYNIREVKDLITTIQGVSWEAATQFDDKSVDFVFIDASHEYADVKKDIIAWLPKVKPGGLIAGHDYHESGVGWAVKELLPEHEDVYEYGIWKYNVK